MANNDHKPTPGIPVPGGSTAADILEFLGDGLPAVIFAAELLAVAKHWDDTGERVLYVFDDGSTLTVWDGLDVEAD